MTKLYINLICVLLLVVYFLAYLLPAPGCHGEGPFLPCTMYLINSQSVRQITFLLALILGVWSLFKITKTPKEIRHHFTVSLVLAFTTVILYVVQYLV